MNQIKKKQNIWRKIVGIVLITISPSNSFPVMLLPKKTSSKYVLTAVAKNKQVNFNPYTAGGYFGQYKMMQKTWKMTETLANGYPFESTQWELSNEYQHDKV